jgi:hypothetical protein
MKSKWIYVWAIVAGFAFSCDNDAEITAGLVGKWQGDKADLVVKPDGFPVGVPYSFDEFDAVLEFKADGTLIVTEESQSTPGTYVKTGSKLEMNSALTIEDINLSGTYQIRELTRSTLKIEIEKDATVKDPNTKGDVTGEVKATLTFSRM